VPLLTDDIRDKIAQRLGTMTRPVTMVVHGDEGNEESDVLLQLTRELAALSENLSVDQGTAGTAPGSDLFPVLSFRVDGGKDPGVRFYGAPTGYEFSALLEDLVDLGTGKTQLSAAGREKLAAVTQPVVIKVFSTPT
jgi:alkyl hydroperoxide reductase subunit AhpF